MNGTISSRAMSSAAAISPYSCSSARFRYRSSIWLTFFPWRTAQARRRQMVWISAAISLHSHRCTRR